MSAGTKFYAPATIADLGMGLGVISYAIDDLGVELVIKPAEENEGLSVSFFVLKNEAFQAELKSSLELLHAAFENQLGKKLNYHIDLTVRIPFNSGLNSKGSCLAAYLVAVNSLNKRPFEQRQLFDFATSTISTLSAKDKLAFANALIGGLVVGYNGDSISDYQRVSMPLGFTSTLLFNSKAEVSIENSDEINSDICSRRANKAIQLSLAMYKSDFDRLDTILQTDTELLDQAGLDAFQLKFCALASSLGCDFVFPDSMNASTLICMGMNSFKVGELAEQFKAVLKEEKQRNYKVMSVKHNYDGCYRY